jgi:hypothetical protein
MTAPKITHLLEELDLFWGHEQDTTAGKSRRDQIRQIQAEASAEAAGVMTGRLRLQR